MSQVRHVWLWDSPDGTLVFGTAKRAREYSAHCMDVAVSWQEINHGWSAFAAGNNDIYEPDIRIYAVEVR